MAKSDEELLRIKSDLIAYYSKTFGEELPQDLFARLLSDYIQKQKEAFILNRINGLDAPSTTRLQSLFAPAGKLIAPEKAPESVGDTKNAKNKKGK